MPNITTITRSLLAAAFCAGLPSVSPAQGGWRQWDIHLHDGRRLEANPLGAPDDRHFSLSVDGYDGGERRIARGLVHIVAARPRPGDSLPAVATVALCEDAIVMRDGTATFGRITLSRVRWSEGVVAQRGYTVDLRDVAYLVFAARGQERNCRLESTWSQPDAPYPVGSRQVPMPCPAECRT
jgi:hypothetical protein